MHTLEAMLAAKKRLYVYLDESGSLYLKQWMAPMQRIVDTVNQNNMELLVGFFTHELTFALPVETKGRQFRHIMDDIKNMAVLSGGTEYKQVWDHIKASPERLAATSIIVTDFVWTTSEPYEGHPENLYYMPIDLTDAYLKKSLPNDIAHFKNVMRQYVADVDQKVLE